MKLLLSSILAVIFLFGVPLAASGGQAENELLIGLIPEINIFEQMERFDPLGQYLTEKSGMTVRMTVLTRYGNVLDNFEEAGLDGAFFGSFTAALAMERLGAEPVARPVWRHGRSTYHGALFVRKASGIRSVADMKGKRMAFVDRATTAGYVFPLAYLRKKGVTDIDGFFVEHFFAGSHDAAIDAVLEGRADVGAAKNTVFDRVRREDPRVDEELRVLAESARVPSNSLLLRANLDHGLKRALKNILLAMHEDPRGKAVLEQFGALRFVETTHEDCLPVSQMAKEAGIELRTYEYSGGDQE